MTEESWLKRVCELANMSDKDIVRYGQWYVNGDGDLFANITADRGEFVCDAYDIYSYDLKEGSFEYSVNDWVEHLSHKGWFLNFVPGEELSGEELFIYAFTLAWHRSDSCDDDQLFRGMPLDPATALKYGVPCSAETIEIAPKAIDRQDGMMVLEYNEMTHQFHHNLIVNEKAQSGGSIDWRPIAIVSNRVASMFCYVMQAKMINGALFTYDQMVAEWNYFLFTYYQFLDDADVYGLPGRESREVMVEVQKRINFYDGSYPDNEMMKLRTIGVPSIWKPEEDESD